MNKQSGSRIRENSLVFTEDTAYLDTGNASIWGRGDKDTLELLNNLPLKGRWLNLAAGDGRYNDILLEKADFVHASDIDERALGKLARNTPGRLGQKLRTNIFDISGRFPFGDNFFDGVFCAGTLHFFPKEKLHMIFSEMDRVLKPKGTVILDFATDIKRTLPGGKQHTKKNEPRYSLSDAISFLKDSFKGYKLQIIKSKVPEEEIRIGDLSYTFSCSFILLLAEKK